MEFIILMASAIHFRIFQGEACRECWFSYDAASAASLALLNVSFE